LLKIFFKKGNAGFLMETAVRTIKRSRKERIKQLVCDFRTAGRAFILLPGCRIQNSGAVLRSVKRLFCEDVMAGDFSCFERQAEVVYVDSDRFRFLAANVGQVRLSHD